MHSSMNSSLITSSANDLNILNKSPVNSDSTLKDLEISDVSSIVNSVSITSTIDSQDYIDTNTFQERLRKNTLATNQQLPLITQSFSLNRFRRKNRSYKNGWSLKSLMPKVNSLNRLYLIEDEEESPTPYNNDWSKQSCAVFLTPIETFLQNQRKREQSSKQRCNEIVKERSKKFDKIDTERRLREYDEKFRINVLLRKSRESNNSTNSTPNSSSIGNYRQLLALENSHKNHMCERCLDKKRKQEKAFLNECMECTQIKNAQLQKPKLPRILPKLKLYKNEDDYIHVPFRKRKNLTKTNTNNNNDTKSNNSLSETVKPNSQSTPRKTSRNF